MQSSQYDSEGGTFSSHEENEPHIFYKHYHSKEKLPKRIIHVILQHGMIEYHLRHQELITTLQNHFKSRVVVSAMDLVGHGQSGGNRAFVSEFDVYSHDFIKFCELCYERFYHEHDVETFIISHSLGGLVVLNTLTKEEFQLPFELKALVFCNPCVSPKVNLPELLTKNVDKLNLKAKMLRLPLPYRGTELTSDHDRAIAFMHDPLISKFITVQIGLKTIEASRKMVANAYFFNYQSLFLLSDSDIIVNNEQTKLFTLGMKKKYVKQKEYKNTKHDLFNETCRKDVFKDIITYIERQSA